MNKPYDALAALGKKRALLLTVDYLLGWDQDTYMPKGSGSLRSEQRSLIASLIHKEETSAEFGKLLEAIDEAELDDGQKAALREWRHDYALKKKLPNAFVEKESALTAEATEAWKEAKENDNFALFSPYLEKIVAMQREKAELIGYKEHPYDALLELFEPDMTVKELDHLFGALQPELTALVTTRETDRSFLFGNFDTQKLMQINRDLVNAVGIRKEISRLDVAAHPFCIGGHPENIRLTTHPESSALFASLSATMHEAGHGLYEQGFDKAYFGTPLAEPISFGIHESQSKFWECFIGQSRPFCAYLLPKLQDAFPSLNEVSVDAFYRAINHVEPSLIRIFSDEVTYSLHIILRYEMEKALLTGEIEVAEIPEMWNAKMRDYIGVQPKSDAEGCLQDVHWAIGCFGYFPTYALGNLYAAEWFTACEKALPDWEKQVEQGKFLEIGTWLTENIHRHGRRYSAKDLLQKICEKTLSHKPFVNYLTKKMTTLD